MEDGAQVSSGMDMIDKTIQNVMHWRQPPTFPFSMHPNRQDYPRANQRSFLKGILCGCVNSHLIIYGHNVFTISVQ